MLKLKFAALAVAALLSSSALASDGSYNNAHKTGDSEKMFAGLGFEKFYGKVSGSFGSRESAATGGSAFASALTADAKANSLVNTKVKMKSGAAFGIGLGAHLSENFRTELMLNFYTSKGAKNPLSYVTSAYTQANSANTPYVSTYNTMGFKDSAFNPMVNFAYDINLGSFVKPYVSAGLGMAFHSPKLVNPLSSVAGAAAATPAAALTAAKTAYNVTPSTNTATTGLSVKKKSAFAYSFGAGLGFEVSKGISLDVGYKYSNLGKPGSINNAATGNTATYTLKNVTINEVEAALRFHL